MRFQICWITCLSIIMIFPLYFPSPQVLEVKLFLNDGGNWTPQLISLLMGFICWMDIEGNGALPFALFHFSF